MRQRGIGTVGTVLLAGLAAVVVGVVVMDWAVVDIETRDEDAVRLKVPVPVGLARFALAFAPDSASAPVPAELREHREVILAVLEELEKHPDATLVRIESPDARVHVRTERGLLRVDVDADDAVVRFALPIKRVRATLARWDWERMTPRLAAELIAAADGELLHVDADDARVRISIW
jgi:hypothetical protein